MRFCLIVVLVFGFVACGDSTAPNSDAIGQYNLLSIDGETAQYRPLPDGSVVYVVGNLQIQSDRTYDYFVLTQVCFVNGCVGPVSYESSGTWTASGATFTLKDSDGTSESWHYDNGDMSGVSGHLSKPASNLVFQRCDDIKPDACLFHPDPG
jgi:hypothetical protein